VADAADDQIDALPLDDPSQRALAEPLVHPQAPTGRFVHPASEEVRNAPRLVDRETGFTPVAGSQRGQHGAGIAPCFLPRQEVDVVPMLDAFGEAIFALTFANESPILVWKP
jgi:hypothetical protein